MALIKRVFTERMLQVNDRRRMTEDRAAHAIIARRIGESRGGEAISLFRAILNAESSRDKFLNWESRS